MQSVNAPHAKDQHPAARIWSPTPTRSIEPALLDQQLGNLDRVGGGTLANLVAAAPEGDAAQLIRIGNIATHATNPDQILVGRVERHGPTVMRALRVQIVHELDARSGGKGLARLLERDVALELKRDALRMRAQNGHAHARAVHAQVGQVHDLAALVLELHLLRSEALELLPADLRDEVARQLRGERTGRGHPSPRPMQPICSSSSRMPGTPAPLAAW